MRMRSTFIRPISVFLVAIFAVWLWNVLLSVSVVKAYPGEKCDGFNASSSDGDVTGMGQTGGGYSLPDMSCFWGEGRLEGTPIAGMDVQIETESGTYVAQTQLYPGESEPRYGIGVWGVTSGQHVTLTGVISGSMVSKPVTVTLDNLSQRVDLDVSLQPAQADLSLQINGPLTVVAGEQFSYTLRIKNRGRIHAQKPRLTVTLPVSATWPGGTIPTLAPNESFTLVVTATAPADFNLDMTAKARISTNSPEAYLANNRADTSTFVRDPRPDVRVNLMGPPVLLAGQKAVFHIRADNWGGQAANATNLNVTLPPGLSYDSAYPSPTAGSASGLSWYLGVLSSSIPPATKTIILTTTVGSPAPLAPLSAHISTTSDESDYSNNIANIILPSSDPLTLILVAPGRLARHDGATPVLSQLYELANHAKVRGIVLDVERDANVQAAYAAWDSDPGNWQKANAVATAIKAQIDDHSKRYSKLKYLVFVGGDEIIPFYRVTDENPTIWTEVKYAQYVPTGTVSAALADNLLLTDDFYANDVPTIMADENPLYLPDLASGRLVESAKEISTTINAFLANNGQIALDRSVVGTFNPLTDDLGQQQCTALDASGIAVSCTNSNTVFKDQALNQITGFSLSAFHSNHFSQGQLRSHDILTPTTDYTQVFMVSIGCHAGLNVPDPVSTAQFDLRPPKRSYVDLSQAILRRGGTYIASTAYGYASDINIGYSEAVAQHISEQLLITNTQMLGSALVEAKQTYFVNTTSFNHLDAKVLQPLTLYGLPMLEVSNPPNISAPATGASSVLPSSPAQRGSLTVLTYTLNAATYNQQEVEKGVYYDFEGKTIAKHGFPVQPSDHITLTPALEGDQNPRGVILRRATYIEQDDFDPVIAEASSMSENRLPQAELTVTTSGWDYPLPYSLSQFEGLFERKASLNLVLGAYHSEEATERLYENMTLEVLYSNSLDHTPPTIDFITGNQERDGTPLFVSASDDSQVSEVIGVCDDGDGNWATVSLARSENDLWAGVCENTERFYVQVVDEAGNVTVSEWQSTSPTTIPLVAGWNLVSIPVQPTDSDITEVLASIAGHYDLVYAYNGCDVADPWKSYNPSAPPFANDLTDVDSSMGLWIHMTSETSTLEVSESEPAESAIPLCTGWNLVGYPSSQPLLVADGIATIQEELSLLYGYNAMDSDDPWEKYDPSAPPFANDLELMEPRRGYWIKVNQDVKWLINN